MFSDLQEAILIAFGAIITWELSAVVVGVVMMGILIIGLGIFKRANGNN
jgi:hypothetical protein